MIKKVSELLFILFVFLSFVVTTYEPPWRNSSMEFFAFLAVVTIVVRDCFVGEKLKINNISIFFIIFILISLVRLFYGEEIYSENFWMAFLFSIFGILFVSSFANFKNDIGRNFLIVLIFSSVFSSVIILCQFFEIYEFLDIWKAGYDSSRGRPYANFGQPNLAASLILTGMCCIIYFYRKSIIGKITVISVFFLMSSALAFASSKTSFLSLFLILVLCICFKSWFETFVIIFSGLVIFISKNIFETRNILAEGDLSTGRFELWGTIVDAIFRHPLVGYGVLNTRAAHFEVVENHFVQHGVMIGRAHNLFLDFFVWFGIPLGFVLVIFWGWIHFSFFKKNKKNFSLLLLPLPIMVHSMLEYPLFNANFLFAYLALMTIGIKDIKETKIPMFIVSIVPLVLFFCITKEYLLFSSKYRELRYFNANFLKSKEPEKIESIFLNDIYGQYNLFASNSINNDEEFHSLKRIIKIEPVEKNFCLFFNYISSNNLNEELVLINKKANALFNKEQLNYIQSCYLNKSDFPPRFSSTLIPPITIPLSTALHIS